jgi:hypothetical protein
VRLALITSAKASNIQAVIELLAIFSVIALRIGKAKETFFEDWITPVPESEGETGAVDGDR